MTLNVALTHRTTYKYDRPVTLGPQIIRLRPAAHARTPILSYSMTIKPEPHFINWMQDPFGNWQARVVFPERVTHFDVTIDLVADMATINPFDFFLEPDAEYWPFTYDQALEQELMPYRRKEGPGSRLAALLNTIPRTRKRTIDVLVELNRMVQERISYVVRMEPGVWTPEETLTQGKGSCRDSAWLLVQILRHLGFAARFVSGYLIQLTADEKPLEGPEGPATDFTDLHAWTEVYLPGAGWIGLDATSGLMAGEGHIPLAATPEPSSAAPISGGVEKCETEFGFDMQVQRIAESPRTTRPYPEDTWKRILAAGDAVDEQLEEAGIPLTMGGEPTFIAANDMDAPEWNIEALGPTKRAYSYRLLHRLMPLWSSGAVVMTLMGKHYPGEQLPRWALNCYWRVDGEPVWQDRTLLATDDDRGTATEHDARRFARSLASKLGIDQECVVPAYEDIHYYLWRESRLPANVLAAGSKLNDPLERARLARVFSRGLDREAGSVLPLRVVEHDGQRYWQSGRWFLRNDTLFLVPGDSPVGFRLPLQSLPWASDARIEQPTERDPCAPLPEMPPHPAFVRRSTMDGGQQVSGVAPTTKEGPTPELSSLPALPPWPVSRPWRFSTAMAFEDNLLQVNREEPDVVRTALTVEARNGIIHVFFPPLYQIEDWLNLCAAVEATAAESGLKVVLEGYAPPRDPRVLSFSVTPDPGVIEVNVHPASSWREHETRSRQLYEEARKTGLIAEKFMLDGRHVGTGGGNHVVMGATRPAESPFLQRPDLLRSLAGFWHNHPSLSYLFSGLFIGPSSQHPRIDEAREDALNELEIAFAQVSRQTFTPPWLTDRLFRNLFADMTGNTHRTEFCIDKLYAPESSSGRLGLVEYRAFEMPPHHRMAATQALLMRACIAAFWNTPYERRLVRWGTRLHDDFMLPHFVEQDFRDAIAELRSYGAPLEADWFAPHFAFRFPLLGTVSELGMTLELRQALEPWNTLAEEPAAGGTARYVDSSVERVEVRVSGFVEERYVLTCNGVAVPLTRTQRQGEYVGGVRFKAWNPPSALHPTIGVESPLTFDLYDTWSGRSVGGMTWHVVHPGGRNYETRPVNANEAEARRRIRFFPFGHTPGSMKPPVMNRSYDQPRTLDLRRSSVVKGES